jgi:prepilin-type N-terminal cleavage/methylation domain-containing protein
MHPKPRQGGLSLIELLVSLTIGSMLIVGAVAVYSQSRRVSTLNDTVARLQDRRSAIHRRIVAPTSP